MIVLEKEISNLKFIVLMIYDPQMRKSSMQNNFERISVMPIELCYI